MAEAVLSQPRAMRMPTCPRQRPSTTPARRDLHSTFSIEEGLRYRFGDIGVHLQRPDLTLTSSVPLLLISGGAVFDGNALDKSSETLWRSRCREARLSLRPRRPPPHARQCQLPRIDVAFVIDQGPAYVERIEIHGNTRTRGYVIRREFDIAEGDRLQQSPDRSCGAASEEFELFQDRQDIDQTGLDAGSHGPRCRGRRTS